MMCPCHPLPFAEAGDISLLALGTRPFTGVNLCITVHFPGNICPEVVRQHLAEIPGGGEGVEETAISSPPEIHSGPPASPQMQHRSPLASGRACCHCRRRCSRRMGCWNSPPSRWARKRLPCSCSTQVGKLAAAKSL